MTPWRQQPLWEEPAAGTMVRDGAGRKVTRPDGKVTTKVGLLHTWLLCTQCYAGTWVRGGPPDQDRLTDEEYRKAHGRPCRLTPRCTGRHLLAKDPEAL